VPDSACNGNSAKQEDSAHEKGQQRFSNDATDEKACAGKIVSFCINKIHKLMKAKSLFHYASTMAAPGHKLPGIACDTDAHPLSPLSPLHPTGTQ